jgi:hypothetical protein
MAQPTNSVWAVRQGPEHNHIDGRTHVHHIHLFNQVTGGEHNIDLLLGSPQCRECGRPFAQSDLGGLDPAAEINAALEMLHANHTAIMAYAGKHGVPIRIGPLHSLIPTGHKVTTHGALKMMHAPRVK